MSVRINGKNTTLDEFVSVARHGEQVLLSAEAQQKITRARKVVEEAVSDGRVIYGITTGLGAFKNTAITKEQTAKLQENLILSHSVGVGDCLPTEVVRGLMLLIVNYLSKGYSGVKWETANTLVEMLNKEVHPLIPEKGSVGSSGDLAPAAHMALVLIGKGEAEYKGEKMSGRQAMRKAGIKPVKLDSKEGLAITNNTSTMTSIASLLVYDAAWLLNIADLSAAMSLQALMGTDNAYDKRIHGLKPHDGQVETARNLRKLLKGGNFADRSRIQEAYSFRCVPQIHGAVREAFSYAEKVVKTELNSVTDNPLIFADRQVDVISGGNFHGESVAIAMDTLGIALSEIGNVSDRRIVALIDPANNNGLPAFLVEKGGLNSGFMILQYTTAALVSENKVLAHPASVDSIPTSANVEDLVSMGTIAARKARNIFENVANVLAVELMTSTQAIDMRKKEDKILKLSPPTQKAYDLIRQEVPYFSHDTIFYPHINSVRNMLPKLAHVL